MWGRMGPMEAEPTQTVQPCSCCEESIPLGSGTQCSSQPPPNAQEYEWAPKLLCGRCLGEMKEMVEQMKWPSHTSPDGKVFWFEKPQVH